MIFLIHNTFMQDMGLELDLCAAWDDSTTYILDKQPFFSIFLDSVSALTTNHAKPPYIGYEAQFDIFVAIAIDSTYYLSE